MDKEQFYSTSKKIAIKSRNSIFHSNEISFGEGGIGNGQGAVAKKQKTSQRQPLLDQEKRDAEIRFYIIKYQLGLLYISG